MKLLVGDVAVGRVTSWTPAPARQVREIAHVGVDTHVVPDRVSLELAVVEGRIWPMAILLAMRPWLEQNPHSDVAFAEQSGWFADPPEGVRWV